MPNGITKHSKDYPVDPPASDVFEVSIFGPGKGESIVVHIGNGRWIVVDSCRDQITGSSDLSMGIAAVGPES